MKSLASSAPSQVHSPQKKPPTSLASVMLTNSEIGRLQQNKRELSDYARKAFSSLKK